MWNSHGHNIIKRSDKYQFSMKLTPILVLWFFSFWRSYLKRKAFKVSKKVFICFNTSTFKMMEHPFFISFLKYLHFCCDFLVVYENDLIWKIRLISKFVMSQLGQQIITIHTSTSISRSKGNHIVCIRVSITPSKTPPHFYHQAPLFRQYLLYIGFSGTPAKNQIFQWTSIILKFSILNPIPSFKSN